MQTRNNIPYYLGWSAVLLLTEIFIGAYVPGSTWLRSFGGDILVIPLIYCLTRIFVKQLPRTMPLVMGGVGLLAELAQLCRLSDRLGFERGSLPAVIIGTSFSWWDVLCYLAGVALIYAGMLVHGKCSPLHRVTVFCTVWAAFWFYTADLPLKGGELTTCCLAVYLAIAAVCLLTTCGAVWRGKSGYAAFAVTDVLIALCVLAVIVWDGNASQDGFFPGLLGALLAAFVLPYQAVLLIGDGVLYHIIRRKKQDGTEQTHHMA